MASSLSQDQILRKQFQKQLDSVTNMLDNELRKVRSNTVTFQHRPRQGPGAGVSNWQQNRRPNNEGLAQKEPNELQAVMEQMKTMMNAFTMLQERKVEANVEDEYPTTATGTGTGTGTWTGESPSRGAETTKAKRKLFSQGGSNKATSSVATQTDEPFSQYLHTAEALETLSHSIFSKIKRHLDEKYSLGALGNFRGLDDYRLSGQATENFPTTSSGGLFSKLKVVSTPMTDPIFADDFPPMPSSLAFDYDRSRSKRSNMSKSDRRREISELMRTPINPPFSKSPKSKGIRRSEYEAIKRKHVNI